MALVLTPVTIDQVAASSGVATSTHSFSPAAGAMVVVAVTWLPFSNSSMTITCADSHSNSYTAGPHATDGSNVTTSAVFSFVYGSAPGSTTLTITSTDTASADVQIVPVVITGQAASQAGAATLATSGTSTNISGSITPTIFGSFVIGAVGMGSNSTLTAATGCTSLGTWLDGNSGDAAGGFQTSTVTIAPTVAETVGFTAAASHTFTIAALEILPAVGAQRPIQAVSGTTTGTSLSLTLPVNTTQGNALIANVVTSATPANPTITSITLGGTSIGSQVASSGNVSTDAATAFMWQAYNIAGGQTAVVLNFTTGNTGSIDATVMEWQGITALDQSSVAPNGSSATTWSSGASGTTTQGNEVVIGTVGAWNGTAIGAVTGPSSPWTNIAQETSASTHVGLLTGYQVVTSTGTFTYNGSFGVTASYGAIVATFKATSASPDMPIIQPGPTWLDLFKPGLPRSRPFQPVYIETEQGPLNVTLPVPAINSFSGTNVNPQDVNLIQPGPAWLNQFKPGLRKVRPQQPVYPYRTAGEQGNLNIILPVPLIGPLAGTNVNPSDMPQIMPGPSWIDLFKPGMPRSRPPVPPDPGVKTVLAPLTVVLPTLITSLSGSRLRQPENLGAVLTLPSPNGNTVEVVESATATLLDYRATLVLPTFAATLVGWTMLTAPLTLSEFNDVTIDIAITQNGSPYNLTAVTVNLLFKTAAGTPDGNALIFSSSGGSPAITITNAAGGLAVAVIPNTDLDAETYFFYRLDVVNAGLTNTCLYGPITWISL